MKDYAKNNYNAKKTLLENGYSENTANKIPGVILESARKRVNESLYDNQEKSIKETSKDVFELIGITREDIIKELKTVILQDKDFTNKLKAMKPLLDSMDYRLDSDSTQKTPTVSLTLSNNDVIEVKEADTVED